ncbi:MAG: serine hydrolase domain-containing protein [Bacteroidia bacterium]|nr:serine hydrolase domain-containing protein [Bacteroidia bacterium]
MNLFSIFRFITLGIIALFFVPSLSAQKIKTVSGESIKSDKLNQEIEAIMEGLDMPGLSIGIINNNELVYHEAFGVSNSETRVPLNKESIFEAASLSKPIFAYFALKLVETGKLDLDKPLYEYFPHPAIEEKDQENYKLITPRMVLSHSTGFPNHSNGAKIQLAFEPGKGFSYSGEAYQYLAAIIGMQHGVGWKAGLNDIFRKNVSLALKMEHSSFLWTDYLAQHKVYGHNAEGKPTHNDTGGWSGETFNAFSSLHSEAAEYAKFIIAMLKQEGLTKNSFKEMLAEQNHFQESEQLYLDTGQTGWGLGFAQKPTPYGLMHLHTGNNHTFQAYTMFIPEQKYGLVVFTNSDKLLDFLAELGSVIGEQF